MEMLGWVRVACEVADVIRHSEHVTPYGGRSDLGGQYGDPEVYTEWGLKNSEKEVAVMREYRWPAPDFDGPDTRPCEHWVPMPRKADADG